MPEPAAKILVADDDQSLVRTLTWILKENGYEVVTAPGGEGLLGKLEDERPNLLLLDIMMPKVDGLQLLARMKADDRFRDVPVLMISRSEEHTSELQSQSNLVCRLLLEKKKVVHRMALFNVCRRYHG